MKSPYLRFAVLFGLAACSNDVDPRVIPGGGISDGEIDGELNIYVIDESTGQPIASAAIEVGPKSGTTDPKGLYTFQEVSGPQTITVKASGHRSAVWVGANGANVTIPLTDNATAPDSATLIGSITGWDTVAVPSGHYKAAAVFYSHSDNLSDAANDLKTPNGGNFCGATGTTCNWTLVSRTGTVTVIAMILDGDPKVVTDPNDDVLTIIGWAVKTGVTVEKSIDQSGLALTQVEAGNLQTLTIDYGTPPGALTDKVAIVGIEASATEVVQIPLFVADRSTLLAPKPTVFSPTGTYRLTAVAQTTSGDKGAQSILLRRNLSNTALTAGEWLVPPVNVLATRADASFERVPKASIHGVEWADSTGKKLLTITVFDNSNSVDVPALVALPATGALTAKVQAIGADLDVTDFSLDEQKELIWGVAAEPVTIQ